MGVPAKRHRLSWGADSVPELGCGDGCTCMNTRILKTRGGGDPQGSARASGRRSGTGLWADFGCTWSRGGGHAPHPLAVPGHLQAPAVRGLWSVATARRPPANALLCCSRLDRSRSSHDWSHAGLSLCGQPVSLGITSPGLSQGLHATGLASGLRLSSVHHMGTALCSPTWPPEVVPAESHPGGCTALSAGGTRSRMTMTRMDARAGPALDRADTRRPPGEGAAPQSVGFLKGIFHHRLCTRVRWRTAHWCWHRHPCAHGLVSATPPGGHLQVTCRKPRQAQDGCLLRQANLRQGQRARGARHSRVGRTRETAAPLPGGHGAAAIRPPTRSRGGP